MNTIKTQLEIFGGAVANKTIDFTKANKIATKFGYVLQSELCNEFVLEYIQNKDFNPNTTFYKEWQDVLNKNRFEIFIDQITMYFTGDYTPNNFENTTSFDFSKFNTFKVFSKSEIVTKITNMLYANIAYSTDTISKILELVKDFEISIEFDLVKNKELKMFLYKETNTIPTNVEEFVRFLVFIKSGKTLLIKDKQTLNSVQTDINISSYIYEFGIEKLASVYRRFKKLFLCMKKGNETVINKLSKLAYTYKEPYQFKTIETLLSKECDIKELNNVVSNISNFKKIAIIQEILVRKSNTDIKPIRVRNGKLWIKNKTPKYTNWLNTVYIVAYKSLIDCLSKKAKTVSLPKDITLVLPTSEKVFVGNIPFGSYINTPNEDLIVGINRSAAYCEGYLDLSLLDSNGVKIGWNDRFKNQDNTILFSGDITKPKGTSEVSECFYIKNPNTTMLVMVNDYSNIKPNYKLYIAKQKINDLPKGYMVNKNDIVYSVDLNFEGGDKEQCIGILANCKYIFTKLITGDKIIADKSITNLYAQYALDTLNCNLELHKVLKDARFTFDDSNENQFLTDKSAIIELLS